MATQRVVVLDEMGPSSEQVGAFVKAVFTGTKPKRLKAEAYKGADVLVCGDWRIINRRDERPLSVPGGTVLQEVLERGPAPKTLIYALLGRAELSRAMRARARGAPAVDGWRRVIEGGGRVIVLQVDRLDARKPFLPADAAAALATIGAKSAVLWHDPTEPLSV